MQAIKYALFILGVICAAAVINNSGLMEAHKVPTASGMDAQSQLSGVTQLNSGSSDDISSGWFGLSSVINLFKMVGQLMYIALLPGPYLMTNGANIYVASMVQVMGNAIVLIGGWQILSKFALGGSTI